MRDEQQAHALELRQWEMDLLERELQIALNSSPPEPSARTKTPKKVKLKEKFRSIGTGHGEVIGSPQSERR